MADLLWFTAEGIAKCRPQYMQHPVMLTMRDGELEVMHPMGGSEPSVWVPTDDVFHTYVLKSDPSKTVRAVELVKGAVTFFPASHFHAAGTFFVDDGVTIMLVHREWLEYFYEKVPQSYNL